MRRAAAGLLAGLLLCGAVAAPLAPADGDPASDTLLSLNAFLPYTPPVSADVGRRLSATLARLKREGKPLKVAVIASAPDLGAVSSLFGRPQTYAEFLSREIAFAVKVPVLVVMKQGFGLARAGAKRDLGSVAQVKVPAGADSDALAAAATEAAARYGGIKVAGLASSDGGAASGWIVAAIVIAGLTAAGVGVALLLRGRRAAAA